jgi:tetratricopeptide (TPR) repeat protein
MKERLIEVKSVRGISLLSGALCCFVGFALSGCSSTPPSNSNQQNGAASPQANSQASPAAAPKMSAGGGDAIDTTKYDEEITQAEQGLKKKPNDAAARTALAHAYLKRAGALTKARQYRSALGDYRRTLRYDPDNEEARNMSDTIISIMKQMNRDVPAEGEEPPPLPYNKEGDKKEGNKQETDKSGLALPKKTF